MVAGRDLGLRRNSLGHDKSDNFLTQMKKRGAILIHKIFPTSSTSAVSSSDERVMVPAGDAERESSDYSMVEAGESARDSSSGGPRRF